MRTSTKKRSRRPRPYESPFIRGHRLILPNHPPEITTQPWFPLTVRQETLVPSPGVIIKLNELFNTAARQIGVGFPTLVCFRISRISVWGPIPPPARSLVVRFYDLFDDSISGSAVSNEPGILEEITNYSDGVTRPRCGYSYSSAQQQKSLFASTSTGDNLLAIAAQTGTGASDKCVIYYNLMWRSYASVPPLNPLVNAGSEPVPANTTDKSSKPASWFGA